MAENITCDECSFEFGEEDEIYKCSECSQVLCKDCREEHNCVAKEEEFDEFENRCCFECSETGEHMYECPECGDIVCEDCKVKHSENHRKKLEVKKYTFEEYVKEVCLDGLKEK